MVANLKILREVYNCSNIIMAKQYLEYIRKVCELESVYEWESVLRHDSAYREAQKLSGCPWDTDIPHIDRLYLRVKSYSPLLVKGGSGKKTSSSSPCRLFNIGKCNFNPCKYAHLCSVEGCGQHHPQTRHNASGSAPSGQVNVNTSSENY